MKTLFALIGSLSLSGSSTAVAVKNSDYITQKNLDENTSYIKNEVTNKTLNNNVKQESDDKGFYDITYLYVDSSKDGDFHSDSVKDGVYYKAKKKERYVNTIKVVQKYNVLNYANSKEDFINKVPNFKMSFEMGYNFWNGVADWTFKYNDEYYLTFNHYEQIIPITGKINESHLFRISDPNHKDNESIWIEVEEFWVRNDLNINLKLYASVNWAWGSSINHLAFMGTKNEKVTFLDKNNGRVEFDIKNTLNTFPIPVRNNLIVDISGDSITRLTNSIIKKKNEGNFSSARVLSMDAILLGVFTAPGASGTSTIYINPNEFHQVIKAINNKIQYGIGYIITFEMKFSVWFSEFNAVITIKVNGKDYGKIPSTVTTFVPGMFVSYDTNFTSLNIYSDY